MRKLVWLALGLTAGCGLAAYAFSHILLLPAAVVFAVAGLLCYALKKKNLAFLSVGLLIGILYTTAVGSFYMQGIAAYDGAEKRLSVTVTDYTRENEYGIRGEGEFTLEGKKYSLIFYCDQRVALKPGDRLEGRFLLRLTTPGGSKESDYLEKSGVYFLAYSRGEMDIFLAEGNELRFLPQRLRSSILQRIEEIFPEGTAAFAKALLLGDTETLDYGQDVALRTTGIRHIVATSGLHVSILFAFLYLLMGRKQSLAALLGIPLLILFAAMAGFSPSVVRSTVMQIVMIVALVWRKDYDPPSALALSVMVILFADPFAVSTASFQLSCSCVVGIFLFVPRLQSYIYHKFPGYAKDRVLLRTILNAVSVSVSTMVMTAPLCALYFENVSLIGWLSNLLTLWVVPVIFVGVVIALLLSLIWLPLGVAISYLCSLPILYVLWVAELLQNVPLAAVYTQSPYIVAWLLSCYAALSVFWLTGRKRHGLLAFSMAAVLLVAVAFSYIMPRLDDYRVTVLDVGQGQCILLQSRGETYVIDCGGSTDKKTAQTAANHLRSQGISQISGLILTHYDRDHSGGVPYFLQELRVDMLYLPAVDTEIPIELPKGQAYSFINETITLPIGIGQLTAFPGKREKAEGNDSICILFQAKEYDILIMSDRDTGGEAALMEETLLPMVDALVIGHHGSASATSMELLYQVKPETAIISVGKDNRYDHPRAEVIEKLHIFGCRILRTDRHGTIVMRG